MRIDGQPRNSVQRATTEQQIAHQAFAGVGNEHRWTKLRIV